MITLQLTGKTRYRVNWRGKVILQVEEKRISEPDGFEDGPVSWTSIDYRDATVGDITARGTRQL